MGTAGKQTGHEPPGSRPLVPDGDLAHAIIALAKSTAETGVIFRDFVERLDSETEARQETNRILAGIADQNGRIEALMQEFVVATRDSARELRVVRSYVESHGEYLVKVGQKIGIPAPAPLPARRAAADR